MKKEKLFFTTKVQKNCRKFNKRIYDFSVNIDMKLVDSLSFFGELTLKEFSKILPSANDVFIIKGKNNLEISGALNDTSLFFVEPKDSNSQIEVFENILEEYIILKNRY